MPARLHGDGRQLWERIALAILGGGDVADGPGAGSPGQAQIVVNHHPPAAVLGYCEGGGQRVGLHPGRPHQGLAREHLPMREGHVGGTDGRHLGPEADVHALGPQRLEGVPSARRRERVE